MSARDAADRIELRRLADVYCSAVDDGDAARMASLFVPEGRLVVYQPGSSEPLRAWSIDGFATLISVLQQSYERWVHFLGNHWVEIDGDRAAGEAYLLAHHLRGGAGGSEEEVAVIRYRDSYVRTAEGWRFTERQAHRQWTTVRPIGESRHEIDVALGRPRG